VLRLVLRSTAITVGCGLTIGAVLSFVLSRVLASRVPMLATQQTSSDPRILAAVVLVLALAATAACLLPARRASSIDPMTALRFE
jgi:putative ABC transport system permease protein